MSSTLPRLGAVALFLLGATTSAAGIPSDILPRATDESRTCTTTYTRKPWDYLTEDEKTAYLEAELCLWNKPSQLESEAVSRYDDIINVHKVNAGGSDWVHFVGAFTNWHRYYLAAHEQLLRDECNYTGATPYWNETRDAARGANILDSTIFQPQYFGGNGADSNDTCEESYGSFDCHDTNLNGTCIEDGYFANVSYYITDDSYPDSPNCITRNLYGNNLYDSNSTKIAECLSYDGFTDFWDCVEQGPHAAGHSTTGGVMTDVVMSPADPVFWLHHAFLDAVYWKWQSQDLDTRLSVVNGTNGASTCSDDCQYWVPYNGDPGNTTTLNHTLYMADIAENLTIADVIDVRAWPSCVEYYYPDDAFSG